MKMKTMQRIFWVLFAFVAAAILAAWGFGIWASIEVFKIVEAEGLKSVVDTIWLGAQK